MSITVFLVRHGEHDLLGRVLCGRMPGVPLNAQGARHALALGERFKGEHLAAVYASPLQRTCETARPIALAAGVPMLIDEDLVEVGFGDWTGLSFDELHLRADWAFWNAERLLARPPGGESMIEVQSRVVACLDRIRSAHEARAVCVVAHGDVIKSALAHALGLSLAFHARFEVAPASSSTVSLGPWGMKVMSMNEAPGR